MFKKIIRTPKRVPRPVNANAPKKCARNVSVCYMVPGFETRVVDVEPSKLSTWSFYLGVLGDNVTHRVFTSRQDPSLMFSLFVSSDSMRASLSVPPISSSPFNSDTVANESLNRFMNQHVLNTSIRHCYTNTAILVCVDSRGTIVDFPVEFLHSFEYTLMIEDTIYDCLLQRPYSRPLDLNGVTLHTDVGVQNGNITLTRYYREDDVRQMFHVMRKSSNPHFAVSVLNLKDKPSDESQEI